MTPHITRKILNIKYFKRVYGAGHLKGCSAFSLFGGNFSLSFTIIDTGVISGL